MNGLLYYPLANLFRNPFSLGRPERLVSLSGAGFFVLPSVQTITVLQPFPNLLECQTWDYNVLH